MFATLNPALLIIDVQQAIDHYSDKPRSNPEAEQNMQLLLEYWRKLKRPIFHIRHASKFSQSPYHPEADTYEFKPEVMPKVGETIITKQENSAFIHTELDHRLKLEEVSEIVICGVLTNNSVDATVRVAAALGYRTLVVKDATAAGTLVMEDGRVIEAELVQAIFLANIHGEYAQVVPTQDIVNAEFG